jgi:hypothetical protein
MSLEFGLILTGLGVLVMFSVLTSIIIACEILKRTFKETEVEKATAETLTKETLEKEKIDTRP